MLVVENPYYILLLGYTIAFFIAWNIGANDASNPVDTVVGARVLSVNEALALFSLFAGVGAVLQGWMVMKTFGKGIIPRVDVVSAVIASLVAGLWIIVASSKGMPISTSQSMSGAVIGVGIAYASMGFIELSDINWGIVYKIVLSWIISPLFSLTLSLVLYRVLSKKTGYYGRYKLVLKHLLISSLIFSAYSFGANDVANATGVYLSITSSYFGLPDTSTRIILSIYGSLGIALGGFTLGKRVLSTVAYKITKIDLISGVAAEYANALTIWLFTTIPYMLIGYGLPVSTTHSSVSSIIGIGLAKKGLRGVNWRIVKGIIYSWILTLPFTIALGFTTTYIVYSFSAIT